MPRVTLPDGRVVHFPDDMPIDQVEAEAARLSKPEPPVSERSWVDTATELLPTAGGIAGGVIGGIGGTVAGMGVGGVPGAIGGATLGGAAGESLRQIVDRLRGADAPETVSDAASRIGIQGAIQGGSELIGAGIAKGATAGAKAVYRGYLKPSLAAKNVGKANRVVQTAIDEALPVSRAGASFDESGRIVGKAGDLIGSLRDEVAEEVQNASGTVDLKRIADRVRRVARQRYYKPGADPSDYQAALAVADRIDGHASLGIPHGTTPQTIPVSVAKANETKRALQASARASFGNPNAAATEVAEKAGARKLRIAVEAQTGGRSGKVAQLNARESKLIAAAQAVAKAVEREANQYPLHGTKSMVSGMLGSGGYAAGMGGPAAIAGTIATRAALHPPIASRAAILASRLSRELGVGMASATRLAGYVLSESGEGDDEQ